MPRRAGRRLESEVAGAVREALAEEPGDLLGVPARGQERSAAPRSCSTTAVSADVVSLHGNLSGEEQDRAIRPSPPGRRKVVLATSIAETSLTIEGVRVVIDAGLSRVPRYSARSGMARLVTVRVPGPRPTSAGTSRPPRPRRVLPPLVGAGGRGPASSLPAGNPGDRPRSARARARRGRRREPRRAQMARSSARGRVRRGTQSAQAARRPRWRGWRHLPRPAPGAAGDGSAAGPHGHTGQRVGRSSDGLRAGRPAE